MWRYYFANDLQDCFIFLFGIPLYGMGLAYYKMIISGCWWVGKDLKHEYFAFAAVVCDINRSVKWTLHTAMFGFVRPYAVYGSETVVPFVNPSVVFVCVDSGSFLRHSD